MKTKPHTSSERGLSTIETLVAVAILAIAIIPILQFQSQLAQSYRRYDNLIASSELQRNALKILANINPMLAPNGEISLGQLQTLRWRAELVSEEKQSTAYPVGDGDFVVALFRIDASIEDSGHGVSTAFAIERLGWRKSAAAPSHR